MELSIINFNIQNKVTNKNYDGKDAPKLLANFINEISPDIICVQELTDAYESKLKMFMPKDFNIESVNVIDNNFSDHKLVKIKIKK